MEFAQLQYGGWLLNVALWVWIFFLGRQNRLFSAYKWIYVYAALSALFSTSLMVVAATHGVSDLYYASLYVASQLSRLILPIIILLRIYFLFDSFRWRRDWHLACVPALLVTVELTQPHSGWVFFRVIYIVFAIFVYVGLCTVARRILSRRVLLGWNLTMVLLALTIPGTLQALVFGAYLLTGDRWNTQLWNHIGTLSSWLIITVGMTEYSPPRLTDWPEVESRVARERMWGDIKLLWRLLRS